MDIRSAIKGSGLPQSDAEILLSFTLKKDRTWIISHPEQTLTSDEWGSYQGFLERRCAHEPIAYIMGEQEFYGRTFHVDRRVLIPRPATEGLVELTLDILRKPSDEVRDIDSGIVAVSLMFSRDFKKELSLVADIGTGSGAIAITLALERPDLRVIATDVSSDALEVARENAKRYQVSDRIEFHCGDGFDPLQDLHEPFLVVCNPPYIPRARNLMKDVEGYEPHVALFGGEDGMSVLQSVLENSSQHAMCAGVLFECEENQYKNFSYST